jgi:hypothetical protein
LPFSRITEGAAEINIAKEKKLEIKRRVMKGNQKNMEAYPSAETLRQVVK